MSFSMSQASVPALEIGLNALSAILDKAAAFAAGKKIDPSVLLNTRLAPDMFPLVRQVQVATDLAKNGAARLAGVEPPRYADNASIDLRLPSSGCSTASQSTRRPIARSHFRLARPTKVRCEATTISIISCCRTSIFISPPPMHPASLWCGDWQRGFSRCHPDEDDVTQTQLREILSAISVLFPSRVDQSSNVAVTGTWSEGRAAAR